MKKIKDFDIISKIKKESKQVILERETGTVFHKPIYTRRNNVGSVFSVIKRIFSGIDTSKNTSLSNREIKFNV